MGMAGIAGMELPIIQAPMAGAQGSAMTIAVSGAGGLASERARHTALTNLFTGRPARGIVNRLIREQGPINQQAPAFPLAAPAIKPGEVIYSHEVLNP
jgi:nitronate monooxygenase